MFFGRASLPAQYADFLENVDSQGLILPTPSPQFFFAKAAMAGRLSAAAMAQGLTGARALVNISGPGSMHPDLEQLVTISEQLPGLINVVEQFDGRLGVGDSIKFKRPVYSVGGLSELDRQLVPDKAISTTGRTVSLEEIPLNLKEFHGPYASGGSGVAPFAIREFDARIRGGNTIQLASQAAHHLSYDYTQWLHYVLTAKFFRATYASSAWTSADTTYLTWPDASFTAVTDFVTGGNVTFSFEQLMRARQTMRDRYIPSFPNGRYVFIAPTSWQMQMLQDVNYRENSKYHTDGRNLIFGYVSSVGDIDIYECQALPVYNAAGTYAGGTVPTSVTINEGVLLGPGAVGFGCALSPETRFSDSTNYQTMAMLIWYAVQAQDVLDDRFVQRVCAQTT